MKTGTLLPIVTALLICGASSLRAQVLLIVNESNPNAVTITSTGASPVASTSTTASNNYVYEDGFELEGFFSADTSTGSLAGSGVMDLSTNLTTGDASAGPFFTAADSDNFSTAGSPDRGDLLDLSIYTFSDLAPETFTRGLPAFSGTATFDLSGNSFSTIGYGVVLAGFSQTDSMLTPIGVYEIIGIPEPSTWALVSGGLGLLLLSARFRSRLAS